MVVQASGLDIKRRVDLRYNLELDLLLYYTQGMRERESRTLRVWVLSRVWCPLLGAGDLRKTQEFCFGQNPSSTQVKLFVT